MRVYLFITVFACCTLPLLALSQTYNGNLYFYSQADLNSFSNYSFTEINGSVFIQDGQDGTQDITNLAGIGGITVIKGNLFIVSNNRLSNTAYLNLTTVEGDIEIIFNDRLEAINGLSAFTRLGGALNITNNPLLTSLSGFQHLTYIKSIQFVDLPLLGTLNDFWNLQEVGILNLVRDNSITNLSGFHSLHRISNSLHITENENLNQIDLSGLDSIGEVSIQQNRSLIDIQGPVSACTNVADVTINVNPVLSSIRGFAETEKVGRMQVDFNPQLVEFNAFPNARSMDAFLLTRAFKLETVNDFPHLSSIRNLQLSGDSLITNIDFLSAVTDLDSVAITSCTALLNIDGLSGLRSTHLSYLYLIRDYALTRLNVFSSVKTISGDLSILSMHALMGLDGLQKLEEVGAEFRLEDLPLITDVQPLAQLKSVGQPGFFHFNIISNDNLENLDGLANLTTVRGNLTITDNPELSSFCGLYNLYAVGSSPTSYITQNLVNPTPAQIIDGGACPGALPVKFGKIEIECSSAGILVLWTTLSESNSSHFNIERSVNGGDWSSIGTVAAAYQSDLPKSYRFDDKGPVPGAVYRIAEYDLDHSVSYSDAVASNCSPPTTVFAGPNPVTNDLMIQLTSESESTMTIFLVDLNGKTLVWRDEKLMRGINNIHLDMHALKAGLYLVRIQNNQSKENVLLKILKE